MAQSQCRGKFSKGARREATIKKGVHLTSGRCAAKTYVLGTFRFVLFGDQIHDLADRTDPFSLQGIESVRTAPVGADSAFDKDDPILRNVIPSEEWIYKLTVEARDGGPSGGTPGLGSSLQFADLAYNRGTTVDAGVKFGTSGLAARSDASGQVSVRFDVAGQPDRSAPLTQRFSLSCSTRGIL